MQARSSETLPAAGAAGTDISDDFERACMLLLLGQQPASGRELCERLHTTGLAEPDTTQVDLALQAFECIGLVCVCASGRAAADRMYRLTPAGADRLVSAVDDLRGAQVLLGWFLARCAEHLVRDAT